MELLELEGRGIVVSFTTLQMPPEGFTPPLTMALVELEHGAVVLSLAQDEHDSQVNIGCLVELSLDSDERLQFQLVK